MKRGTNIHHLTENCCKGFQGQTARVKVTAMEALTTDRRWGVEAELLLSMLISVTVYKTRSKSVRFNMRSRSATDL